MSKKSVKRNEIKKAAPIYPKGVNWGDLGINRVPLDLDAEGVAMFNNLKNLLGKQDMKPKPFLKLFWDIITTNENRDKILKEMYMEFVKQSME